MVVGKIFPGAAVGAVVFAHRAPGALGHVGTPALPVAAAVERFFQALLFSVHLSAEFMFEVLFNTTQASEGIASGVQQTRTDVPR